MKLNLENLRMVSYLQQAVYLIRSNATHVMAGCSVGRNLFDSFHDRIRQVLASLYCLDLVRQPRFVYDETIWPPTRDCYGMIVRIVFEKMGGEYWAIDIDLREPLNRCATQVYDMCQEPFNPFEVKYDLEEADGCKGINY